MSQKLNFLDFIKQTPVVILSGGFGTTLQLEGFKPKLPLWSAAANLEDPHLIRRVHANFSMAGAHVLSTNTFRTQPETFEKALAYYAADPNKDVVARTVLNDFRLAAAIAANNAIHAAKTIQALHGNDQPLYVAGSYGPIGDTHSAPEKLPNARALLGSHRYQAHFLAHQSVDFLLPETAPTHTEAYTMAQAASETKCPFIISFVLDPKTGHLFDGTPIKDAVQATELPGRIGVAINCTPIEIIGAALEKILQYSKGYVGAYANGGGAAASDGACWNHDHTNQTINNFVSAALEWREIDSERVKILGGCCGASPSYIQALRNAFEHEGRHTVTTAHKRASVKLGTKP